MALGAQGFADRRPAGRVDIRHLRRVLGRTGLLQIDSVNVLQRAHYVPLFSRLGAYPTRMLDEATYQRRELFEYWVHEASIVPVELQPLLRHRMAHRRPGRRAAALLRDEPGYIDRVREEVAVNGPVTVADLRDPGASAGSWWGWSKGKVALEHLFAAGQVAIADRRRFIRHYDLTERVLPAHVLAMPTPVTEDAQRALLVRAARHLGVATADDLVDYHRLGAAARSQVQTLAREGRLVPAQVDGWDRPAYLHPEARIPRSIAACTMLSPFDPLVFHRPRAARLFDFDYRIEIYVPPEQRVYGYYVLPFLYGDRLVGRADLKADRAAGKLLVRGAWWEAEANGRPGSAWAGALIDMASWLGLTAIDVADRGDAASALRTAMP